MVLERLLSRKYYSDRCELPEGTGFDIDTWRDPNGRLVAGNARCGTTCCLLGWHVERNPACGLVVSEGGGLYSTDIREDGANYRAADKWLGLPSNFAEQLFSSYFYPPSLDRKASRKSYARMAIERIDLILGCHDEKVCYLALMNLTDEQIDNFHTGELSASQEVLEKLDVPGQ